MIVTRSSVLWEVTQRIFMAIYRRLGTTSLNCFTIQYATERFNWNVGE